MMQSPDSEKIPNQKITVEKFKEIEDRQRRRFRIQLAVIILALLLITAVLTKTEIRWGPTIDDQLAITGVDADDKVKIDGQTALSSKDQNLILASSLYWNSLSFSTGGIERISIDEDGNINMLPSSNVTFVSDEGKFVNVFGEDETLENGSESIVDSINNLYGIVERLENAGDESSLQYRAGHGLDLSGEEFSVSLRTGSGLQSSAGGLSLQTTCASNQVLKWNGSSWICALDVDTDTDTNTTYTAGDGVNLIGTEFRADLASDGGLETTGGEINIRLDANSGLQTNANGTSLIRTCGGNEILKWNGSGWACAADAGGASYTAGNDLDLTGAVFSLETVLDFVTDINGLDTLANTGNIEFQPGGDSDDYVYLNTNTNQTGLFWSGVAAYTNDPGIRINSTTGETEYRDENEGTWTSFDSLSADQFTGTVTNVATGNGLSGGPITTTGTIAINSPTCSGTDKLQWNGTAFVCSADVDTDTDTTYTAGDGLDLTGTAFSTDLSSTGGLEIQTGELALNLDTDSGLQTSANGSSLLRTCGNNEILKWNGAGWFCAADAGGASYSAGNGLDLTGSVFSLGDLTANWDQAGAFDIVLNNASSELQILESTGATYYAILDAGDLGANATYTLEGASGTILTSSNYSTSLDSAYVNVAESPAAGDISGSFSGGLTINTDSVALGTDTTGNYVGDVAPGNGITLVGTPAENYTETVSINSPTCSGTDKLQWNGTAFVCSADVDTDTDTTYTAGDGLDLTGTVFSTDLSATGGLEIQTGELAINLDANSGLQTDANGTSLIRTCGNDEILKWNGSGWFCAADSGGSSYSAGNDLDLTGAVFSLETVLDFVTDINGLDTVANTGNIEFQPGGDSDDYVYLNTNTNQTGLFWSGVAAYTNDPGIRINSATGETEYRDEDEGTWTSFDSLSADQFTGTVTNVATGNGLSGGPITTTGTIAINSPTCSGTDKLQWNGTAFVCSADVDTDTNTTYTAGTDLDLSGTQFLLETTLDSVTTINGLATITNTGDISIQADSDTDDFIYYDTTSNNAAIHFENAAQAMINDAGFRINGTTGEIEYRDENESTWTTIDSLAGGAGSSLWEDGTNGVFEDDKAVIIGTDSAFSWVTTPGIGDLKITDAFEAGGIAYIGGNLFAGASTSSTETLLNVGFVMDGDDTFIAGMLGIEGGLYTDGTINADIATDSVSSIHVNNTGEGGNLLELEDDAVDVLTVTTEGDTTIGNKDTEEIDLTVYGDILKPGDTTINSTLSNIQGTYLYDTTRDKDGGAWRKSTISKTLSWYTETKDDSPGDLCNIATDDRCGDGEFPAKASIIYTDSTLFIFNALSNKLWMKFSQGSGNALGSDTNSTPTSVTANDGRIFVGTNGSASTVGLYEFDFRTDTVAYTDTTDRSESNQTISGRNGGANTFNTHNQNAFALSNKQVNDIDSRYNGKILYVAAATNSGINLINTSYNDKVKSYIDIAGSSGIATDDGDNGNDAVNTYDSTPTTYVRSDAADSTLIVTYQFDVAQTIERYGMVIDDVGTMNEAPEDWTMQGSNNGSSWDTLDTRSNITWGDVGNNSNYQYWDVASPASYLYYRINVSDVVNAAADNVTIGDIFYQIQEHAPAIRVYNTSITNYRTTASSQDVAPIDTAAGDTVVRLLDHRKVTSRGEWRSEPGDYAGWIQVNMPKPITITQYAVTVSLTNSEEPTDWTLYGSNDAISWNSLNSQSAQTFTAYQRKAYSFSNSTPYKFYRLDITGQNGSNSSTEIAELELNAPIITASGSANDTSQDESNLTSVDGYASGYFWYVAATANCWVNYDYGSSPQTAYGYIVRNDNISNTSDATAWILQGSNVASPNTARDHADWTTLDTQTSQTLDNNINNFYSISSAGSYRHYRLYIDANNGHATNTNLGVFHLIGTEGRSLLHAESQNNDTNQSASLLNDEFQIGLTPYLSQAGDLDPWIIYDTGEPQIVTGVMIGGASTASRSVKDFTFYGSNDTSTWTELTVRSNSAMKASDEEQYHVFANSTAYRFYKLQVDDQHTDATYASISELHFMGSEYNNVRFAGHILIGTNETKGELEYFNKVFEDTDHQSIPDISLSAAATGRGSSVDDVTYGNDITYPSLSSNVTSTKYSLETDEDTVYFGSNYGIDKITAPQGDWTTHSTTLTEIRPRVKKAGTYSTTRNISNKFDLNHFWPLDEQAEETYAEDYGTDAAHSFYFGINDYDSVPTSTDSANCKKGRCYDFTGSSADHIEINNYLIEDIDHKGEYSFGAWIYPESGNTNDLRIMGNTYYDTAARGWFLNIDYSDGWEFELWAVGAYYESDHAVELDTWSHVAVVQDGTNFNFYINGEMVKSVAGAPNIPDEDDFYIGCGGSYNCSSTYAFDGRIDEVFLSYHALAEDEIIAIYEDGSDDDDLSVSVTNADTVSTSTIGDSSLEMTTNIHRGHIVEITGGTGAGQTRIITKNTDTTFSISPNWSTTPDSTSDFEVTPYTLPGSVNTSQAVRVDRENLFLGLNNSSDGGGVVRIDRESEQIIDYYHGNAAKTDDHSGSWDTTTGFDDVVGIETTQGNLIIASDELYWRERIGDSLIEAVDKLQQGYSGTLLTSNSQDMGGGGGKDTGQQILRKGWGYVQYRNTAYTEDVYYGITYSETPFVYVSSAGVVDTGSDGHPRSLSDCWDENYSSVSDVPYLSAIYKNKFVVRKPASDLTLKTCYTWLSMGPSRDGAPEGSFGYGADLAEYFATDDTTLKAGEVVSIDPTGNIKVVRSSSDYDKDAIGIIATQPAITLGDAKKGLTPGYKTGTEYEGKSAVSVALAGRVPVRVSLENGVIEPGDFLTTSSKPGIVMKAIKPGPIVGRAMEKFDGSTTITVIADENLNLEEHKKELEKQQKAREGLQGPEILKLDADLKELDDGIGTVMAFVQTGYYWGEEEQDNSFYNLPATGEAATYESLEQKRERIKTEAEVGQVIGNRLIDLTEYSGIFDKGIAFLKEIVIGEGGVSSKENQTLNLQTKSDGNISLYNGKTLFDQYGNIAAGGAIQGSSVRTDSLVLGENSVGEFSIPSGELEKKVEFKKSFSTTPYVIISPKNTLIVGNYAVVETKNNYFIVKLSHLQQKDTYFNWVAVTKED